MPAQRDDRNDKNDEGTLQPAQKSYRTILEQEIIAGLRELRRPTSGLFLSSLSAGLDIGFSVLLMAVALTLMPNGYGDPMTELVIANMYATGFILVLLGRSELFTEHTALAVLPLLRGSSSLGEVARVWAVVFAGNLLGAGLFAILVRGIGPALGVIDPDTFVDIASGVVRHSWWVMILSAVLAGWLMGELGWIIAASRDTISQVVFVWLVTAMIGFAHLHHVVVGTVEIVPAMLISDEIGVADLGRFLVLTTLGNAIGGVVFVAFIKYGHASRVSDQEQAADDAEPANRVGRVSEAADDARQRQHHG